MHSGIELDKRYRLESQLGSGGMGAVWRATDLKLGREVAVKLMTPSPSEGPFASPSERFRRETRISASLRHPGITMVHDAGEWQGHLYLVMEKVDGEDMSSVLRRYPGGVPTERVLELGGSITEALGAAHDHGVVHRDIKPANIMVTPEGWVKICDFGVAKLVKDLQGSRPTAALGTVQYMAPEQFDGNVDQRSDLYSLGCVLYELLTGAPPFHGRPRALMHQHCFKAPPPMDPAVEPVPPDLEALVAELLEKERDDRPPNAAVVRERLDAVEVGEEFGRAHGAAVPAGGARVHERLPVSAHERALPETRPLSTGVLCAPTVSDTLVRVSLPDILDSGDVAVEVANREEGVPAGHHKAHDNVMLGDLMRSPEARSDPADLLCAVGLGEDGPALMDLFEAPHLLVTGAKGAGRSTALRALVTSLLVRSSPDRLRLILVDSPDDVFADLARLPHLLSPVVRSPQRAVASLSWLGEEMERRYDDLAAHRCRTVHDFNEAVARGDVPAPDSCIGTVPPHPSIVAVVDELSVLGDWKGAERQLREIVELARAVGIHLVLSTGSVEPEILSERLRNDIPSRLALGARSPRESELVLGVRGSERLEVPGDALFLQSGADRPIRVRCPVLAEKDVPVIVRHWTDTGT